MGTVTLVHDCDIERRGDGSPPITVGGDFRETMLYENMPDTVRDGNTVVVGVTWAQIKGEAPYDWRKYRGLFYFDLGSYLPASATIVSAVWHLYLGATQAEANDVFKIQRCTRTNWIEDQATWNSYKTGSAWTAPGGDMATPPAVITLASNYTTTGWKSETITAFATDAWDNRGKMLTFLMYRDDDMASEGAVQISAKNVHYLAPALVHHLRVTYTLSGRTFQVFIR